MKAVYHEIDFDVEKIIREGLPFMSAFYSDGDELNEDVHDLFSFAANSCKEMPMYTIKESSCDSVAETFNDVYAMMIEAATKVFRDKKSLYHFFDCEFLRTHGRYFVEYAAHTFSARGMIGQAMYGRFDAAFDPVTEKVTGIYEFNGDTPVMLFDSVHIQNDLTLQVTGSNYAQFNNYYPMINEMLDKHRLDYSKNFAVVCDTRFVEDMATCETLAQIFGEHAQSHFLDLKDLDFDYVNKHKPFVIAGTDTYLDHIFVLSPWEEMVAAFPKAFENWRDWVDNVTFMEPAWRWFLSHKGMFAYITHLMETDNAYYARWKHVPGLRTYLTPEPFLSKGEPYVSKPVLGRLSSNIRIHNGLGELEHESQGGYEDCERVYQEFCPPHRVEGRNNFILGMWMVSEARTLLSGHVGHAATMCIREFDAPVLELTNERFIPHIVV